MRKPMTWTPATPWGQLQHREYRGSHMYSLPPRFKPHNPQAHVLAITGGNVSYGAWGAAPWQFAKRGIACDIFAFSSYGPQGTPPHARGGVQQAHAYRKHWRSSMNAAIRERATELRRSSDAPIVLAGFSMGAVHSIGMLAQGLVSELGLAGVMLLAPALWFHHVERIHPKLQWLATDVYAPGMALLGARKEARVRHIAPELRPHLTEVRSMPYTHLYGQMRFVEETRAWWLKSDSLIDVPTIVLHGGTSERICHPHTIVALHHRLPRLQAVNLGEHKPGHYLLLAESPAAREACMESMLRFVDTVASTA